MDPLIKILTKSGPKTDTGLVGKTFCHQTMSGVNVHFKDRWLNPFLAAGASETCIDEFNEDNFDQGRLGFFGGDAFIPRDEWAADRLQHWDAPVSVCGRRVRLPVQCRPQPDRTARRTCPQTWRRLRALHQTTSPTLTWVIHADLESHERK